MSALFLAYKLTHDPETQTYCMEGFDRECKSFGVGAGKTIKEAEEALKLFVLESLLTDERKCIHGLYVRKPPTRNFVRFTTKNLFPIRLRKARLRLDLTQKDVALRLGVSQQAYRKLEMINANPTLGTIENLECVLKFSILS